MERPHVPLFILIELWIGFSKYDLTKTQSRIMPGVSKLAALLNGFCEESQLYCLKLIMLLPRYSQIQSGCRVLFLPKNPTNPPVSASVEVTNICNSQENLKAVNDERDVGQIPRQQPISKEKIWILSKQRRFPLNAAAVKRRIVTIVTTHQNAGLCPKSRSFCCCRKLKEKAILRFKRQIEEIDYQIAMMEEAKR